MNYQHSLLKSVFFITFFAGFLGPAFLPIRISEDLSLFPFRTMMLILVFVFVLSLLKSCRLSNIIKIRFYIVILLCWFSYAVLTGLWVKSYSEYFKTIAFLIINLGFLLISLLIDFNLNDFKKLYNVWILGLLTSIGFGLWNQISGNYLFEYESFDNIANTIFPVPRSFYYNENDYASFVALSIPFVFSTLVSKADLKMKIFSIVLITLSLFHIVMTFSRTNYIAIIFMFCCYFLIFSKSKFKSVVIIVTVIVISIYAIFEIVPSDDLNTITEQLTVSVDGGMDESTSRRINLIRDGFEYLIDSMGFGIGAGNTEYYMETHKIHNQSEIVNMHNWLMQLLVEYGIIIFALYLSLFLLIISNLYKIFLRSRKTGDMVNTKISRALLLSLILFVLVSNSSSNYMNIIPQWLLFAFSLAYIKYHYYEDSSVYSQ